MFNNNWDQLLRLIVPLSFLAIWALTSLFNRETKPMPTARSTGPTPPFGPRPADPTLRWSPTSVQQNAGLRRVPVGDDDILVIPSDASRQARPGQPGGPRRPGRAKPVASPAPLKKIEPVSGRPRLAGVTQNVNQHLTRATLDMLPLTAMPPTATSTTLGLSTSPSALARNSVPWVSALATSLSDPVRLREAFVVNEILQPPLALRPPRATRR